MSGTGTQAFCMAGAADDPGDTRDWCDCLLIPRIEQPLRYAVQYADESTRLHYNTTA
ncbi:hypothetical protein [Paenibacillus sp. Soil522]|uniref:hypothetical protein n=1 Tax=Paenibacillus sp. Soil522 TaxID=1736388 RepID=UPI0012DD4C33|nr:hypothetical protein [Paenibacillus sp. Soil522]